MKTTIHTYFFDTRNETERAEYSELAKKLKQTNGRCFCTWGNGKGHYSFAKPFDGQTIELETEYLFSDQWNTAPIGESSNGLRVFDWAEDHPINFDKHIKKGHYLVVTDEMREIRRNTHKCGYCGKQEPAQKGYTFCPHCLGNEYLKKSDLHLLRMLPVSDEKQRPQLTEAELAHLLPLYKKAQLFGNTERDKKRIAKQAADIETEYQKAIKKAETEYHGKKWLMAAGIKLDNVIYYQHTDKFSFGWRNPVDVDLLSDILAVISDFPFSYEIKCADGRTLSN